MTFTNEQIKQLLNAIQANNTMYVLQYAGSDFLDKQDIQVLNQFGIDPKDYEKDYSWLEYSYRFGTLSNELNTAKEKNITFDQFKKFVDKNQVPLNQSEQATLNSIKLVGTNSIKGLGNRISNDFSQIVVEADQKIRSKYEKIIEDSTKKAFIQRASVQQIVSDIGHRTKDWSRDFGRIADTEMHKAFDFGRAEAIKTQYGEGALVYKDVYPGACKHCIRLYKSSGLDSKPKVFKLSQLMANGTNYGLKTAEWKPVLGPTHPHCRCTLVHIPEGYTWDEKAKRFVPPGQYQRKVDRKSKVKIKVGDTETAV